MPSVSGNHKIVLEPSGHHYQEGFATAAILPGMNVVMDVTARKLEIDSFSPGAATKTLGSLKVATEQLNVLEGKTVDNAYAIGSPFSFYIPRSGDVLQVLALTGTTLAKKALLSPNAAGKFVADAVAPMVETLEPTSGALAADTLIRVRVL